MQAAFPASPLLGAMPPFLASADWVAWIMLGLFLGILLVAASFWLLARRHLALRRNGWDAAGTSRVSESTVALPQCWLAIPGTNTQAIGHALQLSNPKLCPWAEGVAASEEGRIFIAAPVQGWTLVVGAALPTPEEDADLLFHFLVQLSQSLGEVQYFRHQPALSHHAWVHARGGHIVRAYAWAGETLWNQGNPTPAESRLRLRCHPYGSALEELPFTELAALAHNTERVPALAARWGVDPAAHALRARRQPGLLGEWLAARSA